MRIISALTAASLLAAGLVSLPGLTSAKDTSYKASPEVRPLTRGRLNSLRGYVFEDTNRNGVRDPGEKGVGGVLVPLRINT